MMPIEYDLPLSEVDVLAFVAASNNSGDDALFQYVEKIAERLIGFRMMTVMRYDPEVSELTRVYSNNADKYPVGGAKYKEPTPWKTQLLDLAEPVLSNDKQALKGNFDDYKTLSAMGIDAILNIPIVEGGKCIGTLNFGHEGGWFDRRHIAVGIALSRYLRGALGA